MFRNYSRTDFKHDLIAGVLVGLVALPLAIVFAVAAGARPEQGLYSAIIGGGVVALFSGSRFQVSGPTGAFVVILLGIVNQYGMNGLIIAGFLAGVILVLMGLFKFGLVIKFLPYPVIVGFTAGIGVIIFTSQIKDFFGLPFAHNPHGFIEIVKGLVESARHGVHIPTLIVGSTTLATLLVWGRYNKKIPASPAALLVGIVVSLFFGDAVARVGNIPSGPPLFHSLGLSLPMIPALLAPAFTIALLGAIESLLSAVAADGMTGTKHDSNKELIAQGIGNMVVPFFGGIPITGAIARTAANIRNGARTPMSTIIHSITLLLVMLFFSSYAKHIPMAALAAILMMVAWNMSEVHHFLRLFKAPIEDVAVLLITFFLTIFLDLTVAVGAGVVLAAMLFIKRVSEINIRTLADNTKEG
ncbi:MAG: sodium-independent anion transporter, partial [Deltaproteobacteria bacterium]|nr:sodium-independent anion transporter [Deltaproteobacteria bacterium]